MSEIITPDLSALAVEINTVVRNAETHAKSAMQLALRAGALLNTAKSQVPHGRWEPWLEANCDVAVRTAQAYMRLAKNMPMLPTEEAQRVADLPVREAVRAIATAPETPPRCGWLRAPARDDRARLVQGLRGSADALRRTAHDLNVGRLKSGKVATLRSKLAAARDALDEIAGGAPQ